MCAGPQRKRNIVKFGLRVNVSRYWRRFRIGVKSTYALWELFKRACRGHGERKAHEACALTTIHSSQNILSRFSVCVWRYSIVPLFKLCLYINRNALNCEYGLVKFEQIKNTNHTMPIYAECATVCASTCRVLVSPLNLRHQLDLYITNKIKR